MSIPRLRGCKGYQLLSTSRKQLTPAGIALPFFPEPLGGGGPPQVYSCQRHEWDPASKHAKGMLGSLSMPKACLGAQVYSMGGTCALFNWGADISVWSCADHSGSGRPTRY